MNCRFRQSVEITEVEKIHDTHFMIRLGDKNYVKIYLSPESICCEKFGIYTYYLKQHSFIETLPLVGAQLKGIRITPIKKDKYSEKNEQSIILYTSIGLVFCNVYNHHNSYYPHDLVFDIYTPEKKEIICSKL